MRKKGRCQCIRLTAQVTVYGAITIGLVIMLIVTLIKAAYDTAALSQINAACNLSKEAVFSSYNNELLDKYSIFALKKDDSINNRLTEYIKDNIDNNGYASLENAEFNQFSMMTDSGGENIRKEVLSYMQYGVFSEIINSIKDSQKQLKKAEKVSEISREISQCQEEQAQHNSIKLKLLELVEGIKTTDTGLVIRNGSPVRADGYVVKTLINGEPFMSTVKVYDDNVYKLLKNTDTYIDTAELMSGIIGSESIVYCREKLQYLKSAITQINKKCEEAIICCNEFLENYNSSVKHVESCENAIDKEKTIIGEELFLGFMEDIQDMKNQDESGQYSLCNVELMLEALKGKKTVMSYIEEAIDITASNLNVWTWERISEDLNRIKIVTTQLDNSGLEFDYSQIKFSGESEGVEMISNIQKNLSDGLLALVLKDKSVSDKSISITDLASEMAGNETLEGVGGDVTKEAVFDEYLMTKFNSYTNQSDDNKLLNYEIEYIISGKNSDRNNLEDVIVKLSVFREGINLTSLLTDFEKRNQALTLATTLLGFTGNLAIIKAGQYLIMTLWAYAESIMDLRDMFDGGKALLIKGKNDWHLSLEKALAMDFSSDNKKTEGLTALDYNSHLRILLITENSSKKYYRTMGAMELFMVAIGKSDFRMRNYIYEAKGDAVFKINMKSNLTSINIEYSY